jgi:hypothetical protein
MSYTDVTYAAAYFCKRLHTEAWDTADTPTKTKALSHASMLLNRLNYVDDKTSPTQEDEWPRFKATVIPDAIQQACCELALSLLDGIDPDLEIKNLSNTKEEFGQVKNTFDRSQMTEHILAGVPSIAAWRLVLPWLRDNRSVTLVRAN